MTGPAPSPPRGDDAERERIVDEAMGDVFALPKRKGGRGGIVRMLERIPLIRWFKSSLPGRISAVFLLAATVTLVALLYATPRLEQSLISPRAKSVAASSALGAGAIKQNATTISQAVDITRTLFGIGGRYGGLALPTGSQRVALFLATGDPQRPNLTNIVNNERPSRLARALARKPAGRAAGITEVDDVSRVESAEVLTITGDPTTAADDARVVLSVWQPIDDIERTVDISRQRILVAGIGGASIALLLGVWVTTRLTRRIRTLEAGARKVAQGDFTAQFPGEGSLELSSLARALDEMQRQLAELETARRRFIATASHELRTPLSTLQGFLELLEDEHLPPERRHEFVMHASEQAQRLSKLAADLLDLSRLDVGSVQVRRAPTDVGLLFETLVGEFRVAAEHHGSIITRKVDERAETALIDGDRVLQLLRALVDNALTHTPVGTNIEVAARRQGTRLEFTVSDDGPGIPAAHQREMFEAFVTSDETRGSGLGLAISRELARRLQGDLTVVSKPGSTVFTVTMPA